MMTYHGFLFDYNAFERELKPLLEKALKSGKTAALEKFIDKHHASLTSVMTGEKLTASWREEFEEATATEYGEVALSKYFDEEEDNLVMGKWHRFVAAFEKVGGEEGIALGETIGPADKPFDPTSQGCYFQSPKQVEENLKALGLWHEVEGPLPKELKELREMFQTIHKEGKGLYVKFI
jgi:hypothetical protein